MISPDNNAVNPNLRAKSQVKRGRYKFGNSHSNQKKICKKKEPNNSKLYTLIEFNEKLTTFFFFRTAQVPE